MRKWICSMIIVVLSLTITEAIGQVIVERDVDTVARKINIGPNRQFYFQTVMGYGLVASRAEQGAKVNWWSTQFHYGFRFKWKLWRHQSLLSELYYINDRYVINQKQVKGLPIDAVSHKRERISTNSLSLLLGHRFVYSNKGNVSGNYFDVGVYGSWAFWAANVYVDQFAYANDPRGKMIRSKTRWSQPNYLNDLNYGFYARFGSEGIAIWARYRYSDLIKDTSQPAINYPELPRLFIGLEVAVPE